MILLIDIGNTHVHVGLANARRVVRHVNLPATRLSDGGLTEALARLVGSRDVAGVCLCSVVPGMTRRVRRVLRAGWNWPCLELNARTLQGIGIDYPRPESIGADRLANSVAAATLYGAPVVVVDFGTAVTFDIVDGRRRYIGGIIAPGLSAMTDYLHEKTALLPRIRIRATRAVVGRNTEEAMLIGAVHGYAGLIRELVGRIRGALRVPRLPVVATGGYARLMARQVPEIGEVNPFLTLEGLRLVWQETEAGRGK